MRSRCERFLPLRRPGLSMPGRRGVPSTRHWCGGNRAPWHPHPLARSPSVRGWDPQPPPIPPGRGPDFPADESLVRGEIRSDMSKIVIGGLGHRACAKSHTRCLAPRPGPEPGSSAFAQDLSGALRRRLSRRARRSSAAMSHTPNPVIGFISPRRIIVRSVEAGIPVSSETSRSR